MIQRVPTLRISLFLLLGLLFTGSIFALEIRINGAPHHPAADPMSLMRERSLEGAIRPSVSLDELLPVFFEIESIRILYSNGQLYPFPAEGAELFPYTAYLTPKGEGYELISDGLPKSNQVERIEIEGEPLSAEELEVWIAWEGIPRLKEELYRWGKLHGIPMRVNEVPKSDSKLMSVLRGGGRPPDLLLVQSDYLPALTASGALQPVVRFPLDQFSAKSLDALSLNGSLWALPFYCDAQMLFYRKDLVDKERIPADWTLEEYTRLARDLRARGISPAAWNAYSAYWLIPFQIGFGKNPLLEPDGSITTNDRATKAAVRFIKEQIDTGLLDLRERDSMFSRFIAGETAMMLSASFSIPELERLEVPFEVHPFPRGPADTMRPLLDFKGFAIPRKTRHPLLARRLLLSLSDPALQHAFCGELSKLPAVESAWELSRVQHDYYPVLRRAYEEGVAVPSTKGYKIYKNTLWKMLRFILNGQIGVDQGLDQAQELIENQL